MGKRMVAQGIVLGVALLGIVGHSHAQDQAGTTKPLWTGSAPGATGTEEIDTPTLTAFLPTSNPTRTGVIVAPGGGYQHLATEKEGNAVARWLNARGVAAYVLKYRLGPKYHHPVELEDAQRALRTVRSAAAYDHIGMWGFSAGGHLAATAGTHSDTGNPQATDPVERASSRPDFLVLAYPVITLKDPYVHKGSRQYLLGDNPDTALVDLLSDETQVTAQTPQTFLFATTDDATVPVMNSVLFYSALIAAKVPAEMHLYQHGPHGVGLAPGFPDLKGWPDVLAKWMAARGWMTAEAAAQVTTP